MEQKEFIKNFIAQLDEADQAVAVDINTNFRELENWDSLTAMCVQTMVLDEYDVKISDRDLKASSTVKDIYDIVIKSKS